MRDPIIITEDLTFRYTQNSNADDKQAGYAALCGVNLEIERGSFTAVIGHNGSGKSTLAKCFNALYVPTSGKVYVNGYDTADETHLRDIRRTVGMVFQNPDNQIVSSIVEDDVAFGPENLGVDPTEIRRRVDDALKTVGMDGFQRHAPHLLSGGQKQRVAIAGAIAMRPECIVFDEPTAMLDPAGRKDVLNTIVRLNSEGITCILITHDVEEAAKADRIIALDSGSVVLDCKPSELFTDREKTARLGLDVPLIADLTHRIADEGIGIADGISDEDEFLEEICRLK